LVLTNEGKELSSNDTVTSQILVGNNLEVLSQLIADGIQVDSVVTDPPYGLKFMNKQWDYSVPSVEFWKLVYQVLKPGGHVLSFGGTRTYHRMVVNLEDAGFEIRDQLAWIYGCLDEQTECLTSKGWKHYSELTTDDEILQFWGCDHRRP
jgi:DNA modification methylase